MPQPRSDVDTPHPSHVPPLRPPTALTAMARCLLLLLLLMLPAPFASAARLPTTLPNAVLPAGGQSMKSAALATATHGQQDPHTVASAHVPQARVPDSGPAVGMGMDAGAGLAMSRGYPLVGSKAWSQLLRGAPIPQSQPRPLPRQESREALPRQESKEALTRFIPFAAADGVAVTEGPGQEQLEVLVTEHPVDGVAAADGDVRVQAWGSSVGAAADTDGGVHGSDAHGAAVTQVEEQHADYYEVDYGPYKWLGGRHEKEGSSSTDVSDDPRVAVGAKRRAVGGGVDVETDGFDAGSVRQSDSAEEHVIRPFDWAGEQMGWGVGSRGAPLVGRGVWVDYADDDGYGRLYDSAGVVRQEQEQQRQVPQRQETMAVL